MTASLPHPPVDQPGATNLGHVLEPSSGNIIMTVQQHILAEQRRHSPDAQGSLSWLLSGITLATKMIEAKVRRAGLLDILGDADNVNVQGEVQQKLDIYANRALIHCVGVKENVSVIASEENDEVMVFDDRSPHRKYLVLFDPLDGSSNIDVNVSVGTIFSILTLPEDFGPDDDPSKAVLQRGVNQVAAGYVVYGSSTVLVYTTGHGVHGFTLDPGVGAYVLSHENMQMPRTGSIYSCNEGHSARFPQRYREYLDALRSGSFGREYTQRYIGSLVSDFHRTLLKGGIFLYPPTEKLPDGKLRLLYEANPVAFIAEQAGGLASTGEQRILDVQPHDVHQRTPLVVGSRDEVERFLEFGSE